VWVNNIIAHDFTPAIFTNAFYLFFSACVDEKQVLKSIRQPVRKILAGLFYGQIKTTGDNLMTKKTSFIVQAALIAALYTALTLMFIPISFGHNIFQFRISEALTVLPALVPSAIPGLFIGCLVSNLIGGFGPVDIIFGSIATLLAAVFSRVLRKYPFLVPLPPVVLNALIVGSYLKFLYMHDVPLSVSVGWVALGELLACYALGLPLLYLLKKLKWFC
jgi:uncharacterized membrane protein